MSEFENKKNIQALIWTVAVHAVIFIACFLVAFTTPPPLPNQDLGMEVNLGTSQEGTGSTQPLNPNPADIPSAAPSHAQASPASNQAGNEPEDIATQDEEDAPVIRKPEVVKKRTPDPKNLEPEKKKKVTKPADVPVEPKPAPPKPKAIYSGGSSSRANSGNNADAANDAKGEGLTGKQGDQGAVNGNPTAANHNGLFSGSGGVGIASGLNGRSITQYPSREGQFNEPGKVRMSITIDQQGNVTSYRIVSADNATIAALANKKIKQVRFNASPSAPVTQFGDIVFVFRIQQ